MSRAGPLITFARNRIVVNLHSQIALQLVVNDDAIGTRFVTNFDLIIDWCDILKWSLAIGLAWRACIRIFAFSLVRCSTSSPRPWHLIWNSRPQHSYCFQILLFAFSFFFLLIFWHSCAERPPCSGAAECWFMDELMSFLHCNIILDRYFRCS